MWGYYVEVAKGFTKQTSTFTHALGLSENAGFLGSLH